VPELVSASPHPIDRWRDDAEEPGSSVRDAPRLPPCSAHRSACRHFALVGISGVGSPLPAGYGHRRLLMSGISEATCKACTEQELSGKTCVVPSKPAPVRMGRGQRKRVRGLAGGSLCAGHVASGAGPWCLGTKDSPHILRPRHQPSVRTPRISHHGRSDSRDRPPGFSARRGAELPEHRSIRARSGLPRRHPAS